MLSRFIPHTAAALAVTALLGLTLSARAQDDEKHGRKYKAPPETAHITVTVTKAFNGKPIPNATVIFRPIDKFGKDQGNLQGKTGPDGTASLDIIPVGSTVRLQVLAPGFTPFGASYDVPTNARDIQVKMETPHAQVSAYEDNSGKASARPPGMQEHTIPATAPPSAQTAPAPSPAPTAKQ